MRQPTFFMAFDYDYTGNIALLDLPKVAFFASREVSPEQRRSALRWAEQTIRTGDAVISGFHSPLEAEILERLLAARHPVIWAHARTLHRHYPPHVEQALAEGASLSSPRATSLVRVSVPRRRATASSPRWPRGASSSSTHRLAATAPSPSYTTWNACRDGQHCCNRPAAFIKNISARAAI